MHPDAATPAPDRLTHDRLTPDGSTSDRFTPVSAARDGAHRAATAADAHTRRLSSTELLGNSRELEITHGDALYRLRLTSLGKLILTK